MATLERAWRRVQDRLAPLMPGARQVIARRSSHYVELHQPNLRGAGPRVSRPPGLSPVPPSLLGGRTGVAEDSRAA
jgi:hypothetical protein